MSKFKTKPYRIYVYDTDVAGVVHHSNYLRYFEAGRIEFLRHISLPYIDFQKQGIGFIPYNITIDFKAPLREDDEYQVSAQVLTVKKASFSIKQEILCNNKQFVTGLISLACVKEPSFKPTRLPKDLRETLTNNIT